MIDFETFEVLTFDCYGTLIDWEKGILEALQPVLSDHDVITTDDQVLELYAGLESGLERETFQSYRGILRKLVGRLGVTTGFHPNAMELEHLARSMADWPPFEDTVHALKALKKKYKLAIISNVDDDLFALSNKRLKIEFDFIITAQQAGVYKPSLKIFNYALDAIGLPKEKILHVAQSLYHDHVPAKSIGLTTAWINRRRDVEGDGATPRAEATPDVEFPDLASMVAAMGLA